MAFGLGEPVREIVDLNFQSGPDGSLPGRLLLYSAALYSRFDVPVRSLVVLLRPKADGPNLNGTLTYGSGHHRVEFGYEVIRLWQEPVESYLHAGLAALPLATLCQMPAEQPLVDALREVVREIDRRLGKEANHAEAVRLMTAAYILTVLRVKKNDLAAIFQGVGLMQNIQESTWYDEVLEEGINRGIAQGILRGEIQGQIRSLLRVGSKKFGPPDEQSELEVKAITDESRLERLEDALLTAKSWRELLASD